MLIIVLRRRPSAMFGGPVIRGTRLRRRELSRLGSKSKPEGRHLSAACDMTGFLCELLGHGVAWGVRGFAAAENDHPLFGPSLTPLPTPIDILALRRRRHRV